MLRKIYRPRPDLNPRTSDPEASMITSEPPGSTHQFIPCKYATLVPEVLVKNLPIGRALFKNAVLYFVGEMFVLVRPCINVGYIDR